MILYLIKNDFEKNFEFIIIKLFIYIIYLILNIYLYIIKYKIENIRI